LLFVDQARGALGHVVAEGLPVGVREAGAGEADEVVEDRETAIRSFVVLRRQPDPELAHMRIAERIALEDLRAVLEDEEVAGLAFGALEGHGGIVDGSTRGGYTAFVWNVGLSSCTASGTAHMQRSWAQGHAGCGLGSALWRAYQGSGPGR